jgi:uncharacterized protein YegL
MPIIEEFDQLEDFWVFSNPSFVIHYTITPPKTDNKDKPKIIGVGVIYSAISNNPNVQLSTSSATYTQAITAEGQAGIDAALNKLKAKIDADIKATMEKYKVNIRQGKYVTV